ncbi:MAG: hypothetical protein ACOYOX_11070 [Limnohabitans sp.]|jgi:hypothetical protein
MDKSVISLESLAITFSQNLTLKGFTKRSLRYFKPYQSSGVVYINREVLGLVLMGELLIYIDENQSILEQGSEFFLPPNIFFQVTAGEHGAHFLYAHQMV